MKSSPIGLHGKTHLSCIYGHRNFKNSHGTSIFSFFPREVVQCWRINYSRFYCKYHRSNGAWHGVDSLLTPAWSGRSRKGCMSFAPGLPAKVGDKREGLWPRAQKSNYHLRRGHSSCLCGRLQALRCWATQSPPKFQELIHYKWE